MDAYMRDVIESQRIQANSWLEICDDLIFQIETFGTEPQDDFTKEMYMTALERRSLGLHNLKEALYCGNDVEMGRRVATAWGDFEAAVSKLRFVLDLMGIKDTFSIKPHRG